MSTNKHKPLVFDEEFIKDGTDTRKSYGCFCDGIMVFTIIREKTYWWVCEHYFPLRIYRKLEEHPVNAEIRKYIRVEYSKKEDVIDACNKLFEIYNNIFNQ